MICYTSRRAGIHIARLKEALSYVSSYVSGCFTAYTGMSEVLLVAAPIMEWGHLETVQRRHPNWVQAL